MKRTVSFFVAFLILCGAMLTSCDSIKSLFDKDLSGDEDEAIFDARSDDVDGVTPDPYELDEDVPYVIGYTSNGDGTCRVASIKFNSAYRKEFVLEIPKKSPTGDTVVAIDWGDDIDDVSHAVPKYIVSDVFESIGTKIENADIHRDFLLKKAEAYYAYQNPDSQTSEKIKAEMLKLFPVTRYVPIYVLDITASGEEKAELIRFFDKFYDTNIEFKEYFEFCEKLKEKGLSNEEIAELYGDAPIPKHGNYSTYATSLYIPSTVRSIGENCFKNLTVRDIIVDEDFSLEQLIELDAKLPRVNGHTNFNIYHKASSGTFDIPTTFNSKVLFYSKVCPSEATEREKTWAYNENGLPSSWYLLKPPTREDMLG